MTKTQCEVFTIGHSTLTYDEFRDLVKREGITAIADVRSSPLSRHFPHFNQPALSSRLKEDHIAYVFLGSELGGRPKSARLYTSGVADYEKMSSVPAFQAGIDRVIEGAGKYKIALMCSEHDPLDCHRCLLVSRALKLQSVSVRHILLTGKLISQEEIERQLLNQLDKTLGLFETGDDSLRRAYGKRASKVAYRINAEPSRDNQVAAE